MNKTLVTVALIMLLLHSCEGPLYVPCGQCYEKYPDQVYLEIEMTNDPARPDVLVITVYEGAIEDNLILYQFTTTSETYSIEAVLYKDYTVTAQYYINGKTYIAVDTATPSVHFEEGSCDAPCYYVYNNSVDLRLRYY
jgi:hypothetical protein